MNYTCFCTCSGERSSRSPTYKAPTMDIKPRSAQVFASQFCAMSASQSYASASKSYASASQSYAFFPSPETSRLLTYSLLVLCSALMYYLVTLATAFFLRRRFHAHKPRLIPNSSWFFSYGARKMMQLKTQGRLVEFLWNIFNGDNESYVVRIGGQDLFVTADPENIKALLAHQFNDFELGLRHSHFKPLLGSGIFTLDNAAWKHSRALLRPNFSREKVAHTMALEKHVQNLFKHIRKYNGQPLDLQEYFYRLTVDTSTEFLFGQSVFTLLDSSIGAHKTERFEGESQFYEAFNSAQETCATRAWLQHLYWLCNPRHFKDAIKIVHNFADYYVRIALSMTSDEIEKASQDGYIFLYELVKETRDPVLLRDQLLNIMIAGRDTTAGLMSFTMYELLKNPEAWAKIRQEVDLKFGSGKSARTDQITFETLKKCTYLKSVISEILRLYPSVPINYRFANKNTTLPRGGGADGDRPVLIRKGQGVGYLISATHRNMKYYGKDAHEFVPERWNDRSMKPGWAYLPFNGGPRICLGQQFALTEASYIIARIAQEFSVISDHDKEPQNYPPRMISQLTNSLATGCHIALE